MYVIKRKYSKGKDLKAQNGLWTTVKWEHTVKSEIQSAYSGGV